MSFLSPLHNNNQGNVTYKHATRTQWLGSFICQWRYRRKQIWRISL